MRQILICLILVIVSGSVFAQRKIRKQKPVSFQKHYQDILPYKPQFKQNGWILGPGATFMMTTFVPINKTFAETETEKFEAKLTALGKPGLYAEVGRYRMFQYSKIFKYLDYGISYKGLRGSEKSEGQFVSIPGGGAIAGTLEQASGTFGYHYAEAFFNLNNVWRISKYNFIQNSIGVNAGYGFIRNLAGATVSAAATGNPGSFSTQIHYKLGFGIKMRGNWLLIPALETPILNILPLEPPRSSFGFFASRYRPVILSLRFFFMRPANTLDCTPVRTREGLKMPTDMDKQNKMDEVR